MCAKFDARVAYVSGLYHGMTKRTPTDRLWIIHIKGKMKKKKLNTTIPIILKHGNSF